MSFSGVTLSWYKSMPSAAARSSPVHLGSIQKGDEGFHGDCFLGILWGCYISACIVAYLLLLLPLLPYANSDNFLAG